MTTASWYHASLKLIGRSAGRSAVACAAYRTGTEMEDKYYGTVRDFSRKRDVVAQFTLAPSDAPAWAHDAAQLWNAAEAKENRRNSVVAREWEVALPNELNASQREAIARRFSQWLVDEYGVAVTTGIHEGGGRGNGKNDHMHVMMTTRPLDEDGWARNKLRDFNTRPGTPNPEVERVRAQIAEILNDALAEEGSQTRVDHRSFAERGIDMEPTKHLGPAAMALERTGRDGGDRAAINREILEERLRWQMEQAQPEISAEMERELSQRWENWQPLERGVQAHADQDSGELPHLVRGSPPTMDEEHTGWRHFVDRVRAFGAAAQAKAAEFWHDETSGAPEASRGLVARLFDAGVKLFVGIKHEEPHELAEGMKQAAELAEDLATERAGGTNADAESGGETGAANLPRSFGERMRDEAISVWRNQRGNMPDPGDAFDRMAEQWTASVPHNEGPPTLQAVEPDTPERDGPDIE